MVGRRLSGLRRRGAGESNKEKEVRMMKLTEMFNICDTCVYAPCLCGHEPESCVDHVERSGAKVDGGTENG